MTNSTKSSTIFPLLLCAFFAALTAVCSAISIPLPFTPIPLNLATLAVFLAGGILGWKWGSISQIIYVLLGVIGLPVFHNFTSGIGILIGPTGGYIAGYILSAFLIGLLADWIFQKNQLTTVHALAYLVIAIILGYIPCYILGTLWFMFLTKSALLPALLACVIPFLIGDAIKTCVAAFLIKRLRKFAWRS